MNILAIALFSAVTVGNPYSGVSHQCRQDLVRYFADEGREINLPREAIPGGRHAPNRSMRLSAETRQAFVGSFDALLRHRHASLAFGLETIKDYRVHAQGGSVDVTLGEDWASTNFINAIFSNIPSGEWVSEASRDYAWTNVLLTVTNWVGYATNVTRSVDGSVTVSVSNLYETASISVADFSRIDSKWREDLNRARFSGRHSIYDMLNSDDTGMLQYRWPSRCEFSTLDFVYFDDFLGWGSSTSNSLYGIDGAWAPSPSACAEPLSRWSSFFLLAKDLFGRDYARDRLFQRLEEEAEEIFFQYNTVCPEDWDEWMSHMESTLATSNDVPPGVAGICMIAGVDIPPATNHVRYIPDSAIDSRRISYIDWALVNAFWAYLDTAVVGPDAMPRIFYETWQTNISVSAEWHDIPFSSGVALDWDYDAGCFRASLDSAPPLSVSSPDSLRFTGGTGTVHNTRFRHYGALFQPASSNIVTVSVGNNYSEEYDMPNSLYLHPSAIADSLSRIVLAHGVDVGAEFSIGISGTNPYLTLFLSRYDDGSDPYNDPLDYVEYWSLEHIDAVFLSFYVDATRSVDFVQTKKRHPFDYHSLVEKGTNSIPMTYPNPSYDVDEVKSISAQAILSVAASSNHHFSAWGMPGDDVMSYNFRFMSAPAANATVCDGFWLQCDDALAPRCQQLASQKSGVDFTQGPAQALEAGLAGIGAGLVDILPTLQLDVSVQNPVDKVKITGITYPEDGVPIVSFDAYDGGGSLLDINTIYFYMHIGGWNQARSVASPVRTGGANGVVGGLGAVKWDFKAMKREEN